jgi:uncharacterized protein YicC (UPF0701 family)
VATPEGAFVLPGQYEVRLTADGRTVRQPLTVVMDPRIETSPKDLAALLAFQRDLDAQLTRSADMAGAVAAARKRIESARDAVQAPGATARADAERALTEIDRIVGSVADENPTAVNAILASLARDLESADVVPTAPQRELLDSCRQALDRFSARWKAFEKVR